MQIETIAINRINPAFYNPRKDLKPEDTEYKKLKKSLLEFDLVEPLVWNKRTGNLVGGHQRLKILQERGDRDVEVSIVDLSPTKEKALNLALNKIQGEWDFPKLKDILEELDTGEFDIEITGFDDKEIEDLMTQFHVPEEGLTDDDEIPEKVETVCKTGDLWQLGNHRLLCGDATKKEDVERLMGGEKADMVFTDPPYGIDLDTDYSGISQNWKGRIPYAKSRKYQPVIGDNKPFNLSDFRWLEIKEQFWFGADYYIKDLPIGGSWFVWDKTDGHTQQVVGNEFELLWSNQKHRKELLRVKWAGAMGLQTQDIRKRLHPTQKPIELCISIIEPYSQNGQVIIDLFGGSGSTLIACEKLGRRCFMMEIDEHYCDVIIQRWQNFTGKQAVRIDG